MNNLSKGIVFKLSTLICFIYFYWTFYPFDMDKIITTKVFLQRIVTNIPAALLYVIILDFIGGIFVFHIRDIKLDKATYHILRIIFGICTVSFTFLILGILSSINYISVFLSIFSLSILGILTSRNFPHLNFKKSLQEPTWLKILFLPFLVLGLILGGLPEIEWDSAVYHLPAIREFVTSHTIGIYPLKEPFNFPMAHNLLYLPITFFNLDSAVSYFNLILMLLGIKAVFSLSQVILKKSYSYIAQFIMFISYVLWINMATSRVEVALSTYIVVYYLLKLIALRKKSESATFLSLIILGMIAATKSTGLILALIEIVIIIFHRFYKRKHVLHNPMNFISKSVCIILLIYPSVYWYGKNQLAFGNFNYPKNALINRDAETNEFESLLKRTDSYFSINKINQNVESRDTTYFEVLKKILSTPVPENKYDYSIFGLVKNPHVFSYGLIHDFNWAFLLVFIPLYLFNKRIWFFVVPFSLTLLAIILKGHLIRYAIPLTGLISIASATTLSMLEPKNLKFKKKYLCIISLIFLFVYWQQFIFTYRYLNANAALSQLLNKISANEYIRKFGYSQGDSSCYLLAEVNKRIPSNQTVLLIGDNKEFYVKPKIIGDFDQLSRQAIPWIRSIDDTYGNHESIYKKLKREKINYIAVNLRYYERHYNRTKLYEKYQIHLKNLDRCYPVLLEKTLIHLGFFLKKYTKNIYFNRTKKIFIYKLND